MATIGAHSTTQQHIPRATIPRRYTRQEYLEMEERAAYRSEYRNGAVFPMAGASASISHNQIVTNMLVFFSTHLNRQDYRVFANDLRVWIPARQQYTYPDVVVVAHPPALHEQRNDTITNPLLIVEVLSPTTRDYDRGSKFASYRTIDSFREYVLIDPDTLLVEHYARTTEATDTGTGTRDEASTSAQRAWLLKEYTHNDATIQLSGVGVSLRVRDIYEQVDWSLTDREEPMNSEKEPTQE